MTTQEKLSRNAIISRSKTLKVYPFRCCDGGAVVLRAVVKLDLASLIVLPEVDSEARSLFQTELVVDLFQPTQRVEYRERIKAMRAARMSEKAIAKQLGLTVTATQRASALTRKMEMLGITSPYLAITEPPAEVRWTRHLHKRFKFDPLVE